MKWTTCLTIVTSLALSGGLFVGCQSNNQPHQDRSDNMTSGGNGEFGESPSNRGAYQGTGTDASGAPTTQP